MLIIFGSALAVSMLSPVYSVNSRYASAPDGKFIKWVEFNAPESALETALNIMKKSVKDGGEFVDWTEILALAAVKYSGNWKRFRADDFYALARGEKTEQLKNSKYYPYYHEVFKTVLAEFAGYYILDKKEAAAAAPYDDLFDGEPAEPDKRTFGLKAFSPFARGYGYSHCDDFGNSRSYGYKRRHLGHDMMGRIGTPIVAVESGVVTELGWNRYGGWRVGIRSFDGKRYYYYAHLRKNNPYNPDVVKGGTVVAGSVIGYLGMTGYSTTENVNNINIPHLHFGMQLIFDESQLDGSDEIWINVYPLVKLLERNRSPVYQDPESKHFFSKYDFRLI